MSIISYFEEIVKYAQTRSLRIYLVLVNVLLVVFGIWFSNAALLPFRNLSDFAVFVVLGFLFAIYRPGWALLFFIGTIALENVNLAPEILGVALRPYQFFAVLTIGALIIRMIQKKSPVGFVKMNLADWAVSAFALAGFLSALFSVEKGVSFKQSLVTLSFVAIYFLVRTFIKDFSDIKKILPFFLSSSLVVLIYGIWQNVRFAEGLPSFEVMPGRPNATFTEADWLGIFVVFLMAVVYSIIFYQSKQVRISNLESASWRIGMTYLYLFIVHCLLILVFIVLILTVARSAWLGAGIVTIGFLKIVLFSRHPERSEGSSANNINGIISGFLDKLGMTLNLKEFFRQVIFIAMAFILSFSFVKIFNLTAFELGNRAQSTASGLQEITISCSTEPSSDSELSSGSVVSSVDELSQFGCAHIDLEEIASEKEKGRFISTVFRPDPNVGVRSEIYRKSVAGIKNSPIFGIGWGGIGKILGTDGRGASLNTSNIFLEVWLGAGLLGLIAFVSILVYILVFSLGIFFGRGPEFDSDSESNSGSNVIAAFAILGLFAILIPNLFNAGIFLGFLWVFLGVAVSLLNRKNS